MHSLGTFVQATWPIPQNPIREAGFGDIVEDIYFAPGNGLVEDIIAKAELAEELKRNPVGLSGCGPSTCPCQVGFCGPGMGALGSTLDDVLSSVTSAKWTTWLPIAAGGILALYLFTGGGGSQRRAELAAARAQYKSKVASIKAERPRRYQRFV